ncbi:unnamed protein product [Urochloa decumbens]|uniref:DUF4283 domain-containing protein n=1 Tax=Urochloa decumbens TaxID=240449 RepID=A0ABC9BG65_9POAL
MDFIPGDAERCPDRVFACAARSTAVREAERDLLLCGLIAVQLDSRARLTCEGVLRDALLQLGIPGSALQVSRISTTKFLLRFERPELRNAALARHGLSTGHTTLHLMPWSRPVCATISSKLPYRARVCLEGVPDHAHHVETVMHLLPKQSFVEGIDYTRESEDERGCFILWIWCKDPEALCIAGTLKLEEPLVLPEEYYSSCDGDSHLSPVRSEELSVLEYEVLLHLDHVEDYSPPQSSSFGGRIGGAMSSFQWPERHRFVWHLGQPDRLPDPPRLSAHARLGGRQDRSLPREGGVGGLHQAPPPNQYDMYRAGFRSGNGPSMQRDGSGGGGYNRHRRLSHGGSSGGAVEVGRKEMMWREKTGGKRTGSSEGNGSKDGKPEGLEHNDCMETAVPFHFHEKCSDGQLALDPMVEEAGQLTQAFNGMGQQQEGSSAAGLSGTSEEAEADGHVVLPVAPLEAEAVLELSDTPMEACGVPAEVQASLQDQQVARSQRALVAEEDVVVQGAELPVGPINERSSGQQVGPLGGLPGGPHVGLVENGATTLPSPARELFDLNTDCVVPREGMCSMLLGQERALASAREGGGLQLAASAVRPVLGDAKTRLNKDGRASSGNNGQQRGISRFSVPLKKSLLCTPVGRPKVAHGKKNVAFEAQGLNEKKICKPGKKNGMCLPVEEKATALLMRTAGIIDNNESPTAEAHDKFGLQFAFPMQLDLVGDMRNTFGLPASGGAGVLEGLASDAADDC